MCVCVYHRVGRSISRDEPDSPLMQCITNAKISQLGTLSRILNTTIVFYRYFFQSNKCITSLYSASLRTHRAKKNSIFFFFFLLLLLLLILLSSVDLAR